MIRQLMETPEVLNKCQSIALLIAKYDTHTASDIQQQTFLEMLENEKEYSSVDSREDFYSLFGRLAVNAYNRAIYHRKKHVSLFAAFHFDQDLECIAIEPEQVPEIWQMVSMIRDSRIAGILSLSLQGYTQREIAASLHLSRTQVNNLRRRGMKHLRTLYNAA